MRTVVAEDDVTRPIVPVKITNALTGRFTVVFGMIDSGADRDVLSLQTVKKLDLPTEKMLMRVHTLNSEVVEEKTLTSFILSSIDGDYNVHVSEALTGNLLTGEADVGPYHRNFSDQSHLRDVPFPEAEGPVQIIIGAAHYDATMPTEARRGPPGSLTAFKCGFGWTVAGKGGRRLDGAAVINAIHVDDLASSKSMNRTCYHDFATVSEEEMGQSEENLRSVEGVEGSMYPNNSMIPLHSLFRYLSFSLLLSLYFFLSFYFFLVLTLFGSLSLYLFLSFSSFAFLSPSPFLSFQLSLFLYIFLLYAIVANVVEEDRGKECCIRKWVAKVRRIAGMWKTAQEWRRKMEAKTKAATLAMPDPDSVFMTNAYNAQRRLIDAIQHKYFRREVGKLQMSSKLFPTSNNAGSIAIINGLAARRQTVRRLTLNCGTKLTGANRSMKGEIQSWKRLSWMDLQRRGYRWRHAQARVDAFRKICNPEFPQSLHERSKRTIMKVDGERDPLVVVVNETLHRHQWSSECVVKAVGSGAHVRKAQIQWLDGKIVLKGRSKIDCLELDSD